MKQKVRYYHYFLYGLLVIARGFFSILPYRAGFSLAGALGKIAFYIARRERNRAISHLSMAFGSEKSEAEIRQIARGVFEHYGKSVVEFLMMDRIIANLDQFVTHSGYENFDKALKAGKGAVCVIAHFGNWELMGGYTSLKGYPCNVIARNIYFRKYDDYIVRMRKMMKVKTIYRDESVRAMLNILRKNEMLGFVVDQDVDFVEGVFADFFGHPAYTAIAPVRFAMAVGAPILPVFMVREGMRHRMIVEPAIELTKTGNKDEDIRINTQRWVAVQEKFIRKYPHLWVWNHRRWKTQPAGSEQREPASQIN